MSHSPVTTIEPSKAIVMFLSVLRHLKIQKHASQHCCKGEKQTRENNKIHVDI
jgi:hypothetical protein